MSEEITKVEFTDDLYTGIEFVDAQHHQLIDRINMFLDAIQQNDEEFIEDTVGYVLQYTLFHFKSEENVMMRSLYEEFELHRDQHSLFIKKMFALKIQIEENGITEALVQTLKNELLEWLITHIQVQDKKLASIEMEAHL
ncbi:bacteriohemerythrin [Aneurinibacillus uraniidurans]|uniref:bacteriohemerythrin n=1 Tax=Aneurinibacillus uraniidurans TaxID=2966586 RepID=UPI0023493212|nr:bacteriohemerythrin [Aneurinibacillus sp. B1]WCN37714.1 bacteriohemerythrin [Aneurinibacillus sp. B1]